MAVVGGQRQSVYRQGGDLSESYEWCQCDAHKAEADSATYPLSLARLGVFVNIVVCVEDGAGEGPET